MVEAAGVPMQRAWHSVTRSETELPGAATLFLDHLIANSGFARIA
jgi:hypothetical protein